MLITRLFHMTAATGLTLALCRRARALFWAAVGAVCLIVLSRTTEHKQPESGASKQPPDEPKSKSVPPATLSGTDPAGGLAAVICVNLIPNSEFIPQLAQVGGLPVLLRLILSAQAQQARRIVVCMESEAERVKQGLRRTGRLPANVEWREKCDPSAAVREVSATSDRIMILAGTRTYKPALLQSLADCNARCGATALMTGKVCVGVTLSRTVAREFAEECSQQIGTLDELCKWTESRSDLAEIPVAEDDWQDVNTPADTLGAEHKLDKWLVKPTDGMFARNNRRISIPISRQLIKLPITPNMVTLFTLGVSIAAGVSFSRGGYWNFVLGAALSVWASILDGCDGEVARLKLQSTMFGCWLETICDYLYYVIIFFGISLGLNKSSGTKGWIACGAVLLVGAALSFVVVGFLRGRMAGDSPDKFLAIWQTKAESRQTNPLIYIGRHTEFLARRCFFPYALLVAAIFNVIKIVFALTAFGANMIWIIALYSWFAFSQPPCSSARRPDSGVDSGSRGIVLNG